MRSKQKSKVNSFTALVESEHFLQLDSTVQQQILDALSHENDEAGGIMGKILGSNPANLAVHVVLILCLALLLIILIDNIQAYRTSTPINMELISAIIPVITLALGYVFGKSEK